jgi:proteasome assembly chaperone (PAC2) family protein
MDPVKRLRRPTLRRPRALLAFEGWNDASEGASGAVGFLLGQHDAEPFAVIEPEDFYDFQSSRPSVEIGEGGTRRLSWPGTRFYALELEHEPHDLVVVIGDEPNLRWKTYARLLAGTLADSDVDAAVILGAFIGQVPHTAPVPLMGVATDPEMVIRHELAPSSYEGPTGIVGVALEAFREVGIPAMSIWAAVPHYLAANPNPMVMQALLEKAGDVLGITTDTSEIGKVADEFRSRIDEAMRQSSDLESYVRRIEEEAGSPERRPIDPGEGDSLITEIEQFLRDRDR